MKILMASPLAVVLMAGVPAQATDGLKDALDFHRFEAKFARTSDVPAGYAEVRAAVSTGLDAASAVAMLRHAGAHCPSATPARSALSCYYRETIEVADTTATYATWNVRLQLNDGKVSDVSIERTTEQR